MVRDSRDGMRDRVRKGYEEINFSARQPSDIAIRNEERGMVDTFVDQLPEGVHVVDMGCGSGVPYDRFLVEHGYDVTGIDVAETNIKAAREQVPDAWFVQADFSEFEPDTTFDGLLCLYALFHIPREEHAATLDKFHDMLKPGAPIFITMGTADVERMTQDFDGVEMEWSFYDANTNRGLIEEAGFDIHQTELIPDDRGDGEHLWVLAETR